ncbi:MAG TPA: polyamine aminopropyltransferase [Acetivibrio sp.]|nr:polyamine aminopropyltransferase [Clostridium sp.]HOQ36089.1 polyamine aminopropyltransferase [Acetivibrio sp.]HPT90151.1 polyamine aminopropyltransferase [Acetivibrio sp.]HQA58769.1 polyamine aminopropyltransferase [Acetivibrio sp.]
MEGKQLDKHLKRIGEDIWLIEDDRDNLKLTYRGKEIISSKKSPFQQVDIVDLYDFGKCLVLDGVVQTTVLDGYIYNEMISHIPIVTHDYPRDVLIIGGGDCGAANEVLKYEEVQSVDVVEIDEVVVKECIEHLPEISGTVPLDERVNFIFTDGVEYVKNCEKRYDVIIIDSSDPVGPAVQLFSEDFYKDVKKCLKEDGIMVCQSQSPIFNKEILRNTYKILNEYYPIVRVYKAVVPSYPGGMWSFTLASLKYDPVNADTSKLKLNTLYVNREIFEACFKLPNIVKECLIEAANK